MSVPPDHHSSSAASAAGEVDRVAATPDRYPRLLRSDDGNAEVTRPGTAEARSGSRGMAQPTTRTRRKVLIVEDNRDGREALRDLLELWGYEVEEASDGREALAAVVAHPPTVALIDIGLPGLDGYAVARQLRSILGNGTVRLIAMTGYGQPEDRRRAFDAGFDLHLTKPLSPEELRRLLADIEPFDDT